SGAVANAAPSGGVIDANELAASGVVDAELSPPGESPIASAAAAKPSTEPATMCVVTRPSRIRPGWPTCDTVTGHRAPRSTYVRHVFLETASISLSRACRMGPRAVPFGPPGRR